MIGKEVGNYRILKELGRGGMGVVYKANQTTLGRMVAMKVLPQHLTNDSSFVKRFENEARAIAKLNHPNIVQIYDIGHENDFYYYTMEFVEGASLDDIIYKEGFLPLDRATGIVFQVARALQYAHSRGIIHRDIKPSNIMIDKSGRVKVTDCGLALQERTTRLTMEGSIVGTPEYMSPEQAVAEAATARSDIYSLGVVFYELLTGKVPFEGESALMVLRKIETSEPDWPRAINPDISIEAEKVIRTMMAKKPRDRYTSCQELIRDLKKLQAGQPIPTQPRKLLSPRLLLAAAACFLILGAAISYRMLEGKRQKTVTPEVSKTETTPAARPLKNKADISPPSPESPSLLTESAHPPATPPVSVSPEERLAEMSRQLSVLEEQLEAVRARKGPPEALWADQILFKKGNKISCEIIGESLEKVRIRTASGVAEIPREEIKLTVYATPEEEKIAENARAEEQKRVQEEQRIRSSVDTLEGKRSDLAEKQKQAHVQEETKLAARASPSPEKIAAPTTQNQEQPTERAHHEQKESIHVPLSEKSWEILSDCTKKAGITFENGLMMASVGQATENSSCSTTVRTIDPIERGIISIEILAEVKRLIFGQDDKVISSLVVTFVDGKSIEYILFDSQAEHLEAEVDETPDSLRIIRPQLSILPNESWHSLLLPVAEDSAKIKGEEKIATVAFVHRQLGPVKGLYAFRCKAIILNAM